MSRWLENCNPHGSPPQTHSHLSSLALWWLFKHKIRDTDVEGTGDYIWTDPHSTAHIPIGTRRARSRRRSQQNNRHFKFISDTSRTEKYGGVQRSLQTALGSAGHWCQRQLEAWPSSSQFVPCRQMARQSLCCSKSFVSRPRERTTIQRVFLFVFCCRGVASPSLRWASLDKQNKPASAGDDTLHSMSLSTSFIFLGNGVIYCHWPQQ